MAVTLPAASVGLRSRYWGRSSPVSAGDTDLEGGQKGIVREAHYAYSEAVGGDIVAGRVDGSVWASNTSSVTYQSGQPAPLLLSTGTRRVTVYVDGADCDIRLGTSLGNSSPTNIAGAGQGSATYTRAAPYTETEIRVWLDFRWDGVGGTQGEVYRWAIYEEPLTVGEL